MGIVHRGSGQVEFSVTAARGGCGLKQRSTHQFDGIPLTVAIHAGRSDRRELVRLEGATQHTLIVRDEFAGLHSPNIGEAGPTT